MPKRRNYGHWLKKGLKPDKAGWLRLLQEGSFDVRRQACAALLPRTDLCADDLRAIVRHGPKRTASKAGRLLLAMPDATGDDARLVRDHVGKSIVGTGSALLEKADLSREELLPLIRNHQTRQAALACLMTLQKPA